MHPKRAEVKYWSRPPPALHQALQAIGIHHRIRVRLAEVELEESLRLAAELNVYAYDYRSSAMPRSTTRHFSPWIRSWRAWQGQKGQKSLRHADERKHLALP
jgi:hypothetical protein